MCISGVLCPGQAWRTQSLVFSIPSAPASASASAPASSWPPLRSISGPRYMLFVLSRSVLRAGVFFSLTAVSLSTALVHMGSRAGFMGVGASSVAVYPASCTFFFLLPTRAAFFFLSLSVFSVLPFFLFRRHLYLSLSSALSPPRPASCGYVAAVGGQRANDVYERNVNESESVSLNMLIPRLWLCFVGL
jgi:hypothetical protein